MRASVTEQSITRAQCEELRDLQSPVIGNVRWAASVAAGHYDHLVSAEYWARCVRVCVVAWNALADAEQRSAAP